MSRLFVFSFIILLLAAIIAAQDTTTVPAPAVRDIQIKEIAPFNYYAVEMTGSYAQHDTAFQILYDETYRQGLSADDEPFGIYWSNSGDTPVEQLKWEIGMPLQEVKELKPPLAVKKWEFPLVAVKQYEGPFDQQMQAAYGQLFEWIGNNGYQPAGPMMEKYLDMPVRNENGVYAGKIEMIMPVQKTQ